MDVSKSLSSEVGDAMGEIKYEYTHAGAVLRRRRRRDGREAAVLGQVLGPPSQNEEYVGEERVLRDCARPPPCRSRRLSSAHPNGGRGKESHVEL